MDKPVSERANELTEDIDMVEPLGIVRMLRGCDAQMFAGYRDFASLNDAEVIATVDAVTAVAAEVIAAPCHDSAIVLSGAGTSGRLAFLLARTFNQLLERHGRPRCFHHLLAGGNAALLQSQEGAEDSPKAALDDLRRVEGGGNRGKGYRRVLLVGISCGLAATYVAAQIEYAMKQQHYAVLLLGFNPMEMARKLKVPAFNHSFFDVATQLKQLSAKGQEHRRRHFILDPVLGPEAISGSTRLKGGSATKLLLEIIFGRACAHVVHLPFLGMDHLSMAPLVPGPRLVPVAVPQPAAVPQPPRHHEVPRGVVSEPPSSYRLGLLAYESVVRAVYDSTAQITTLIELATESLAAGGSIYYVGAGNCGILGVIDASEQVPTFGANAEDVQGFVVGGWSVLLSPASLPLRTISARSDKMQPPTPASSPADPLLLVSTSGRRPPRTSSVRRSSSDQLLTRVPTAVSQGGSALLSASLPSSPSNASASLLRSVSNETDAGDLAAAGETGPVASSVTDTGPLVRLASDASSVAPEMGAAPALGALGDLAAPRLSRAASLGPGAGGGTGGGAAASRAMKTAPSASSLVSAVSNVFAAGAWNRKRGEGEGNGTGSEWNGRSGRGEDEEWSPGEEGGEAGGDAEIDGLSGRLSEEFLVNKVLPRARHTDLLILLRGAAGEDALPPSLEAAVLARKRRHGGIMLALLDVVPTSHDRILCVGKGSAVGVDEAHASQAVEEGRRELEAAANVWVTVRLPAAAAAPLVPGVNGLGELAVKLVLNAVSTGAHVMVGKVYRSLMVDLRVSNVKLLQRATSIVENVIGVSQASAYECILRAIYGLDNLDSSSTDGSERGASPGSPTRRKSFEDVVADLWSKPASDHVTAASTAYKVVPTALLLATGRHTLASARAALKKTPVVRKIIATVAPMPSPRAF